MGRGVAVSQERLEKSEQEEYGMADDWMILYNIGLCNPLMKERERERERVNLH